MAKENSFYDQMLERKAEVEEMIRQVNDEIQRAESRISEIDEQKTAALHTKDMKAFTDLCAEKAYLQEYVTGNQDYLKSLSYKYPVQTIMQQWDLDQARVRADVKQKMEPALDKAARELKRILDILQEERTTLNARVAAYDSCIEKDPGYPLGISAVGYKDFPFIYELHECLKMLGYMDYTGKWLK